MTADSHYSMSAEELYFFDLRGYLILPQVLSVGDLEKCNEAIDQAGVTAAQTDSGMLGWPAPYREPFRTLLVHPTAVSRLNELCGSGFRLDDGPSLVRTEKGPGGQRLQSAGDRGFDSGTWYHQQNGRIFCRAVTVLWKLTGVAEDEGGFAIIPGSHNSCEPKPSGVGSADAAAGLAVRPAMNAGDALLFAKAATHGWLPPPRGRTECRCLQYRFASRGNARSVGRFFAPGDRYGDWTAELTETEQAVLYGPGVDDLPTLESDGDSTWISESREG